MELQGELKTLADFLLGTAGPRLVELRAKVSSRDWKAQTDYRTEADLEIEAMVVGEMRRKYPHLSIYSEESGELGGSSDLKLVLDPIDGTIIWSTGLADFYSIAAAFVRGGSLESSLIYFPASKTLYAAARGRGAWQKGSQAWERLSVSKERNFQHAIVAVDHGKERRQAVPPIINKLLDPDTGATCVPQLLCSSYTLVKLAEGAIHGYVSPSAPCEDALPGLLMAREAGAVVGTLSGAPEWSESDRSVIVGCNNDIYDQIRRCI